MTHWREHLDPDRSGARFLSWKEVARATGLSRTTAWRLQKRDDFPAAYTLSPGRVAYRADEVDAWRASRSRNGPSGHGARSPPGDGVAPPDGGGGAAASPQRSWAARTPAGVALGKPRRRRRSAQPAATAQQIMFDF